MSRAKDAPPPAETPDGALRTLLVYFGTTGRVLADPMVWPSLAVIAVWLGIGTVAYMGFEGWSALDALYFTVVTLTTVGFGDVSPQTAAGKAFTIVYILIGVATLAMLLNGIVHRRLEMVHQREARRHRADPITTDDELV